MKKLTKIEQDILKWNTKFPIDRWWREKHKIAFLSFKHKSCPLLSQVFEYNEDIMAKKYLNQKDYIVNIGDYLNTGTITEEDAFKRAAAEFKKDFL